MSKRLTVILAAAMAALAAQAARADGDATKGQAIFKRTCAVCHTVEAGKNKIGPSLFGVVGRKSGSLEGFNYSPAMKGSNLTWTADQLDAYIADPKKVVPGNRMAFAGLKKDEERKDVIAYLSTLK
jgi:cytochrome c